MVASSVVDSAAAGKKRCSISLAGAEIEQGSEAVRGSDVRVSADFEFPEEVEQASAKKRASSSANAQPKRNSSSISGAGGDGDDEADDDEEQQQQQQEEEEEEQGR